MMNLDHIDFFHMAELQFYKVNDHYFRNSDKEKLSNLLGIFILRKCSGNLVLRDRPLFPAYCMPQNNFSLSHNIIFQIILIS